MFPLSILFYIPTILDVLGRINSFLDSLSHSPEASASSSWHGNYAFDTSNWPYMPTNESEFAADIVARMWENRPAQAHGAVCYSGAWQVTNPHQVSPAITVAYFDQWILGFHKRVYMYDCVYIWGPDQSWLSKDDADSDKMAFEVDDSRCAFDKATWNIDCA